MLQNCSSPLASRRSPGRRRSLAAHPAFPIIGGMFALLAYLGMAWLVLTPQAVWSPDEGIKLLQLQNLHIENGRLTLDIAYLGRDLDPALQFVRPDLARGLLHIQSGALYSERLPLFALLALPSFLWLGFHGLYLLPAISGGLCGTLALLLLDRHERRVGMWLLIAFATPIAIYSTIFWEHTLATGLGLVGALLVLQAGATGRRNWRTTLIWVAGGAVLGASAYVRLEMVIFASALLAACWLVCQDDRQGIIWAGVTLGLVLLPYIPLHLALFGQPVPDNARYLFYPFSYLSTAGWRAVPDVLVGPFEDEAIDPGWLGTAWALAAVIAIVSSLGPKALYMRTLRQIALGITAIAGAAFLFSSTYYRSAHGLLFTCPWALLGVCGMRQVWQRGGRRAKTIVLATALGLAGYIISILGLRAGSPHGGLEWGNRFAMTFYPFLAMITAWDWGASRSQPVALAIAGALLFLGLGFQARGLGTIRHDKQINGALNRTLLEMPEPYVVSDLWWMPFNAAPIYTQKVVFVAPTPEKVRDWIELAGTNRVQQFCLVTLNSSLVADVAPLLTEQELGIAEIRRVGYIWVYRLAIVPNLDNATTSAEN
jgi:hypothetical protein